MAAKKKPVKKPVKKAKGKPKTKKTQKQLLTDARADLAEALGKGKGGFELLAMSDDGVIGNVSRYLPIDVLPIESAVNMPGLPYGRLVEVYGKEDSGKSTLTLHCMRSAQQMGGVVMVVDTENKASIHYAAKLGVKVEDILLVQPSKKTFESVIRAISVALDTWIKKGNAGIPLLIVWDSIAGTPTESEYDEIGDVEDSEAGNVKPGEAAKLIKKALRALTERLARAQAMLLVVNQVYETFARFGKKSKTFGGSGIRYHATVRIEMIRTGWLKAGAAGNVLGITGKCHVIKNNLGAPQMPTEYGIVFGVGIDNYYTLFDRLKGHRYITTAGAWHTLGIEGREPMKFQQGFMGLAGLCEQNDGLYDDLVTIYKAL